MKTHAFPTLLAAFLPVGPAAMRRLRHRPTPVGARLARTFLCAAVSCGIFLRAQIADEATAVPVHFQGLMTALATGDPDEPASARIVPLQPPLPATPAYGENQSGSESYTGDGIARLRPGKSYYFRISSHLLTRIRVKVTPPAGHRVFINGVEHEMFDWALGDGTVLPAEGGFDLRLDDGSGAPVGQADSLRPGRLLWSVGLGNLRNGKPAGSLRLVDDGITDSTFRPSNLYYDRDSGNQDGCYLGDEGEVLIVKVGGTLRQVYAPGILADIDRIDDRSFFIRLYPRGQVGEQGAGQTFAVNGAPLHEFVVENPSHPALTSLRITRRTEQNGSLTMWTQLNRDPQPPAGATRWLLDEWVEKPFPGALDVVSPVRHRWTYTDADRNEHFEILDAAGFPVHSVFKRFSEVNFGAETTRELEYEIAGYGGPSPIRTDYAYHTSATAPGNWRRVRSIRVSDGSWTAFDYHDDFASRGQLRQVRRPFGSAPAADPGFGAPSGEVTTHSYDHLDAWGTRRLPTLIETRVNGTLAARSQFLYSEETVLDSSTSYDNPDHRQLPVVVVERRDFFDAHGFLTTRTRTYREDADPEHRFFRGLLRSVERPDKTMTVAVYFRATFGGVDSAFVAHPDGGSRVHVSLQGTHDTTTGIALPSYPELSQPIPSNFRLVDGRSSQNRTLLGEHGQPLATEQQVYSGRWVVTAQEFPDYTHSVFPLSTTRRSGATGPTWNATVNSWTAGRLRASVDDTGNRQSFDYDSLGHVRSITREGGSAQGVTVASQTTTRIHDAAGRLISSAVSAGGESLVTTRAFDLAGRLVRESSPGTADTTHTYDVAGRSQTVLLPTGSNRTETRLLDGRIASVHGSAVVTESYEYIVDPDGRRRTTARSGGSGEIRQFVTVADWLGRPVERSRPGFQSGPPSVERSQYDPVTGLLIVSEKTGYANTRYEYDSLGALIRSGLDLDSPGLKPDSTDRLTDTEQAVEEIGASHWLTRRTWTYATHGSANRTLLNQTRQRLTGLSPSLRSETRSLDIEGNETIRTVEVFSSSKEVRISTTSPGQALAATEVSVAGVVVAATGHDGLTVRTRYDSLGRMQSVEDPRTGAATTSYYLNTALPFERRDGGGRLIARLTYDNAGRPIASENAATGNVRTSYTARGEIWRRWGSAINPVAYDYDAFGQRTHQHTYRDATGVNWDALQWPAGATETQTTRWEYDHASGLLHRKVDPAGRYVEYRYNERGQVEVRTWARERNGTRVATTYDYFPGTGEPRSITHTDGTPSVSFLSEDNVHYTRLGQPRSVTDASGRRTLIYDPTAPWRLMEEGLSPFYGSRKLATLFDSATSANSGTGGYGSHILGSVKGRVSGYRLGTAPSPSSYDLEVSHGVTNGARFAGLTSRRVNGSASRQFVYGYEPTASGVPSALVKSLSIVGHAFQVTRSFEASHDLPVAIDTLWNGSSRARFDYLYNHLLQRQSVVQSGSAFSDLGATHQRFTYSSRGELTSAYGYHGPDPASTAQPLAGRLHDYAYDAIGNRVSSNSSSEPGLRDDCVVDALNQIRQRENNTLTVGGTVTNEAGTRVAVSGPAPLPPSGGQAVARREGRYWGTNLVVNNLDSPFLGPVTAYAVVPPANGRTNDTVHILSRTAFLPPVVQSFSHDEDGNLLSDGLWTYTWDAENRLSSMSATPAAIAAGRPHLTLKFTYDYRHRRIAKEVRSGPTFTLLGERRYLYDGWNVIAEFDGTAALKRSFTWGLDLNGGVGTAGGVGGLLQIHDATANQTLLPAFDGNGNLAALLNADTGAIAAAYEYSPFGELLRATGAYALANPFRFSTKWQDDESGLLYYGYRYYAPREGRFINRDPIEEQGGLNLYGFCGNDPLNHWDYLGQKSWLSKLWNKFRHTIISAALYAIPVAGPTLSMMYNTGVGARYGGIRGAVTAFAASSIGTEFLTSIGGRSIGNAISWSARLYGIGRAFAHGVFWDNLGNFAAHLGLGALAHAGSGSLYSAIGLVPDQASAEAKNNAAIAKDVYYDTSSPKAGNGLPGHIERVRDPATEGFTGIFDDNTRSGSYAALYRNVETGGRLIAFRGTEGRWNDIWTDIAQGLGIPNKQYQLARLLAAEAKLLYGNRVTFIGHSLGGGLAAAAAISVGGRAFVYNSAGVHPFTIGPMRYASYDRSLIQHYHITTDLLTFGQAAIPMMPGSPGTLFPMNPSQLSLLLNPAASHSMENAIKAIMRGAMGVPKP